MNGRDPLRLSSQRATHALEQVRGSARKDHVDGVDSSGRARRFSQSPLRERTPRPAARPNVRVRLASLAPSEQRRRIAHPRPPRAPQAPGRSSQSSADVGVLRGRLRSQSNAEYVAFRPGPRVRPLRCRGRSSSSPDSTVCFRDAFATGFRRERGHFSGRGSLGAPLPTRAGRSADRRERTADRPVEAPTYVFADRPAPERDPPRAPRARGARSPRTPVRDDPRSERLLPFRERQRPTPPSPGDLNHDGPFDQRPSTTAIYGYARPYNGRLPIMNNRRL